MKRAIYAGVGLIAVLCTAWAFYVLFFQQVAEQQPDTDGYSFPQGNDDGTLSLSSRNGGTVSMTTQGQVTLEVTTMFCTIPMMIRWG